MNKVLELPISELAGYSFDCECGRRHEVAIKKISVGSGVFDDIIEILKDSGAKQVCLIADGNTMEVAGKRAQALLEAAGIPFHSILFPGHEWVVPNEQAIGRILAGLEPEDELILTVGSGTLNDLSRLISTRTGIPYMIAATAPSMDGYASVVSPVILDGHKITLPGVYPMAIVADISIMKNAPDEMMTSGYGDIIGKFTAEADWRLSHLVNGDLYCETCAALVRQAVQKCADNGAKLRERDDKAVEYVTEALILSGLAIGLFGDSRPASGVEHHFAHYWEVDALNKGQKHALHGNYVSVGAVVSAHIYELAAPYLPEGFTAPTKDHILSVLTSAGAPTRPQDVNVDKELFHRSVLHAMEIRERYTILRYCSEKGLLEGFADTLTEAYFPD